MLDSSRGGVPYIYLSRQVDTVTQGVRHVIWWMMITINYIAREKTS